MNNLIVANITINRDNEGRYCLNDLHKAAGTHQKHRPKYWLENDGTKALLDELEKGGIPPIHAKQGLGTFAVKELVYAYAMWISPKFHLEVIRAYDNLQTNGFALTQTGAEQFLANPIGQFRRLLEEAEKLLNERNLLIEKVEQDAPKVEFVDKYVDSGLCECLTTAWKSLGYKPNLFNQFLGEKGVLTKRGSKSWLPKQEYLNVDLERLNILKAEVDIYLMQLDLPE